MTLSELFESDDAVSPVIGVILMVAITVILAAVAGAFVLGLGQEQQAGPPQASLEFDYSSGGSGFSAGGLYQGATGSDDAGVSGGTLTITHASGDNVNLNRIAITDDDTNDAVDSYTGTMKAGDTITVKIGADDSIRVTYNVEDDDTTTVLGEYEAPEA